MKCTNPDCGKENDPKYSYCMYCGQKLPEAETIINEESTQNVVETPPEVPVAADGSEPLDEIKDEAGIPYRPPESPVGKGKRARDFTKLKKPAIVILLLVLFSIIAYFSYTLSPFGSKASNRIVFGISENYYSGPQQLISIDLKGGDEIELFSDPQGFNIPLSQGLFWQSPLSPDGHHFAVYEGESGLVLFGDTETGSLTELDETDFNMFAGYSTDSKYFAFTIMDTNSDYEPSMMVVDMEGNITQVEEEFIFLQFLQNSNKLLVGNVTDVDDDEAGIGIYNLSNGEYDEITFYEFTTLPAVTSNGKYLYIVEDGELIEINISKGSQAYIYEYDSGSNASIFVLPELKNPLILDSGELLILTPQKGDTDRIDVNVVVQSMVKVSPNGKYIAYVTDSNGDYRLNIYEISNKKKIRLDSISKDGYFEFTKDSKQIIFKDTELNRPGRLYAIDIDGENKTRIDKDVTSFIISPSRNIIYYSVLDERNDDYESEIYQIKTNGKNKEKLYDKVDGVISIYSY